MRVSDAKVVFLRELGLVLGLKVYSWNFWVVVV